MKGYPIPAQETHAETLVVNSRFICTIAEARSTDEAMTFIRRVKEQYHDASSHAYAFHVGFGASVTDGCNDGGEPSGTAGRPMLAVLQGSGLGDVGGGGLALVRRHQARHGRVGARLQRRAQGGAGRAARAANVWSARPSCWTCPTRSTSA